MNHFYRLGLKMGAEKIEKWNDVFRLSRRAGIDLPNERAGIPPSRKWKAKVNPKDPAWRDDDTAAVAIGQGITITPLQMLWMIAGVAVGGEMITPHLLLRGAAGTDRFGDEQPEIRYTDEKKFTVTMSSEIHQTVARSMWGVVNENGAGGRARRRLRRLRQDQRSCGGDLSNLLSAHTRSRLFLAAGQQLQRPIISAHAEQALRHRRLQTED